MLVIERMQDFSEIIPYEQKEIPLYIRTAHLSDYPGMSAPCHWHEDLEWILILEGSMYYDINGKRLLLQEHDALMVNARQMHFGSSNQKKDCRFACVLFHPSLFCSNPALLQHYVTPVLKNCGLEYLHFCLKQELGRETEKILSEIVSLKERAPSGYELEAVAWMQLLWNRLWQAGILASGQDYLQQSPVDFLNACRLKVSCRLLDTTDQTVTEIALACGFNHLSYFSKSFCAAYGCTPREYRRRRLIPSS